LGDFGKLLIDRREIPFSEEENLHFLANITMIVNFLNSNNIYHRDLKPENFLMSREKNGNVYLHLSDFGLAKTTKPEYYRATTSIGVIRGTVEYLAPEILESFKKKPNISK
jgi:serine/threonine protein kinase